MVEGIERFRTGLGSVNLRSLEVHHSLKYAFSESARQFQEWSLGIDHHV